MTTMIDGLWMRNALQPTSMPPAEAVAHMEFALDQLFTQTEFSSSERTAAREKSRA
ncbi:MAG: TetR family transcriptional regulator C-terminal domain-containing protein [Rhodobacteraceae bacterium]|nr:TetR family transcriptional regulator C-terminal domain-containing protein [Paracoccaceae bacterium]